MIPETGKDEQYRMKAKPSWLEQLIKARQEQKRTVFLLHFNIRDLVFDPDYPPSDPARLLTVKEYLFERLSIKRHLVLEYSLHSGIQARSGTLPGNEKLSTPQGRMFRAKEFRTLWREVAQEASRHPYPLVADQSRHGDEPGQPDSWSQPRNVMPLLTRVFTQDFPVQVSKSSQTSGPSSSETADPRPLSVALIIDYLHHLVPAPGGLFVRHDVPPIVETLQSWSTSVEIFQRNHLIVVLTPEIAAVDPELVRTDSYIERIQLERPTRDQRFSFLTWLSQFEPYAGALQEDGMIAELANRASGMNYRELRDFVVSLISSSEDWREILARRRADIIRRESGGLLEPKESKHGLEDVAGYRYITQEIERRLPRIREGKADIAGILFNGPPGTGKSFYASALAKSGGVNMVVIRNLRSMWVGQSERNLEQIFEVAKTLAPVIIFVDEIDQMFASRDRSVDTAGGVEQRLLGRLLEFMDDKTNLGKVLWIAASNRPDLIDPALLSRFKLRLPFLLPDRSTCIELLRDQLPRQAEFRWQPGTWDERVVDEVVGKYSGRELETIVRQALWKAQDDAALLSDGSGVAANLLGQRQEQLAEHELTIPITPVKPVDDSDDIGFEVHGQYLWESVLEAEVGHDPHEYLLQSLRALNAVPFTSSALLEAVRTALPKDVVDEIIVNGRLDKEALGRLIRELSLESQAYGAGRRYR